MWHDPSRFQPDRPPTCPDDARQHTRTWVPSPLGGCLQGSWGLMSVATSMFRFFLSHIFLTFPPIPRHAYCSQPPGSLFRTGVCAATTPMTFTIIFNTTTSSPLG